MLLTLRPIARTTTLTFRRTMATASADQLVIPSRSATGAVTILTLNRPKALNALSSALFEQLNSELDAAEADSDIKAIVLTGGDKVFAGASGVASWDGSR